MGISSKPKKSRTTAFSEGSGGGRTEPVVSAPIEEPAKEEEKPTPTVEPKEEAPVKPVSAPFAPSTHTSSEHEDEDEDHEDDEEDEDEDEDYDEDEKNEDGSPKTLKSAATYEGIRNSINHIVFPNGLGATIPEEKRVSMSLPSIPDEDAKNFIPGPYETDIDKIKRQFIIQKDDTPNKDDSPRYSAWYSSPDVEGHTKLTPRVGVIQNFSGKDNKNSGRTFFYNWNGKAVKLVNGKSSTGIGEGGTSNFAPEVPTGSIYGELNLAIHQAAKKVAAYHSKVNGILGATPTAPVQSEPVKEPEPIAAPAPEPVAQKEEVEQKPVDSMPESTPISSDHVKVKNELTWEEMCKHFDDFKRNRRNPAGPRSARLLKKGSPGIAGHLLDLDSRWSALGVTRNTPADDPRQQLAGSIRDAAMTLKSHMDENRQKNPNEVPTSLPGNLFRPDLLSQNTSLDSSMNIGQPEKIDANHWASLTGEQKKNVSDYIANHKIVENHQLPGGQIKGTDESLEAYNGMHAARRKLEQSFGATAAAKVGNPKYDDASKKTFDLLQHYPLGLLRIFN